MDLGGAWRATVADEHLRRVWSAGDFDDTSWPSLSVPGHWASAPAFSASDGPLLYRREVEHPRPDAGQRHWLVFDGIFYQGDVWFDGAYLGATEGYFFPHTFEVTEQITGRDHHTLAIEVTCTPPRDRTAKRNLTGVFQHAPGFDADWNPGGLWRPLRLESSGSVRLRDLQVLCAEATPRRASVSLVAVLDSTEARSVVVRSSVGDVDRELVQPVAAGLNRVEWTLTIDDPVLWWPWALGDQSLVDVAVDVLVDGQLADQRRLHTGLRSVELRNWICSVNGERLFLKGTNQGPTRMALAEATSEEIAHDVQLAVDAGLDLMRVHGHISRPELYDAADRAGLLLWQDLPLFGGYARGVRREAARQARAAVQLLGHHPSVAVWCGHDEPAGGVLSLGTPSTDREPIATAMNVRGQQLPTWNRTVLDRSVKRAFEKSDSTRPVIAHSGVLPHLPQLDGTDSHLWFGWHWGEDRLLAQVAASLPRLVRFVSEFGAQAVPDDADFCEPERWPNLDWDRLERRHALQKDAFDRHVPPSEHTTFAGWRTATQAYQAMLIKHHVETLRRLKYRPTGGFAQFCFADSAPGVTWSVLDHDRRPKTGFRALADACQPVIVVADRPPPVVLAGDPLTLDVHVVSDRRDELKGATVTARVTWPGDGHTWRWRGDIPPDSCTWVKAVQLVVPDVDGRLLFELALDGPVRATNAYSAVIVGTT